MHSSMPDCVYCASAGRIAYGFLHWRQITMTFLGKPRTKEAEHAVESKWTMTLPLVILAVFALGLAGRHPT